MHVFLVLRPRCQGLGFDPLRLDFSYFDWAPGFGFIPPGTVVQVVNIGNPASLQFLEHRLHLGQRVAIAGPPRTGNPLG
jgi:hypothetical protein